MAEMEIESREKVKRLLKQLFQFDMQDLDFGIYRIMNFKRKEIEKFIEDDLIKAAEEEFKEYARVGMVDLQKEVERLRAEIIRDFGEGTIDEQGNVRKHEDAPKIKEYLNKLKELGDAKLTHGQIDDVFNHIYEFFSRYYDNGDFLSKRRYGGREKYYVPYNGEEVILHWANNDQYYIKSGEYFKKYSFKAGGYRVNFVLKEAAVELNNAKGEQRYFLLCEDETFKLDREKKELDIFFNWRALIDEEKKKYGTKNVQEAIMSDAINRLLPEIGDKGPGTELRRKGDKEKTLLEQHLKKYVQKNTADYFIHKNLKKFLERVLDFFAGSGTTAHAVMELNKQDGGCRKFILVELADFFDSITLARLKKVAYSFDWKNGRTQSMNSLGAFFKYHNLEQYEDTLNNIVFREKDKTIQETLDGFQDYFLRYMLDYETRDSPTRLTTHKFQTPFDYKIKTINGNEEKEQTVDLVETFNYLLGLNVSKMRALNDSQRLYYVVYGKRNKKDAVIIWRDTENLDLEKDKKFIEEKVLSGNTYNFIFINGDSYVKNAKAIEPEFKKLMGA